MTVRLFTEKELHNNVVVGTVYRPQQFSIIFLSAGSITIKYNLSEFDLSGPCLFTVIQNGIYEFTNYSECTTLFGVSFDRSYLRNLGIFQKSTTGIGVFSATNNPSQVLDGEQDVDLATKLFTALNAVHIFNAHNEHQKKITEHSFLALFYFVASIYERTTAVQGATVTRSELLVRQFLELISNNYTTDKNLKFYADKLHVSSKHLSATVKKITGNSAGTYIDRAVIIGARLLLSNPSLTIAQVSQQLNFSDQFIFSKFFKKHTSLTPTLYRRREGIK